MQYQLDLLGNYHFTGPVDEATILSVAERIREAHFYREAALQSPSATRDYLVAKLAMLQHEVFVAIFLDNRHAVLAFEILFTGTIDGASVYPREVVKRALHHNAAAVIFRAQSSIWKSRAQRSRSLNHQPAQERADPR